PPPAPSVLGVGPSSLPRFASAERRLLIQPRCESGPVLESRASSGSFLSPRGASSMAPGVPTQAVYAERIKKAQAEMKRQGIDILLVGPSSDLVYLIGYDAHLSERLNLLIIRQEGTPDLVVPVLESF